jgi:hypothetical protein
MNVRLYINKEDPKVGDIVIKLLEPESPKQRVVSVLKGAAQNIITLVPEHESNDELADPYYFRDFGVVISD